MDETFLPRFERLIAIRAGLQLRPREREGLNSALEARVAALHLRNEDAYYQMLQSGTQEAENEWELLLARLTNNESYFFRDKGQMALLRERLLPELIARNGARRSLRLWSAGCSTGEETYSLAMLVDELLPQRMTSSEPKWDIVILGTDIDGPALRQAQRGVYSAWSFRTVEPALQQRYFHRQEDGWHVTEASRSLVTFGRCNLVGDPFPNRAVGLHDMDLILCRNVFIYFEREAVSAVLLKFAQTLRDGGYLMTGHSETYGRLMEPLQARRFPEAVVYQRVNRASGSSENSPTPPAQKIEGATAGHVMLLSQSPTSAMSHPKPLAAQQHATSHPPAQEPAGDIAILMQAQAQANLGHYEEATRCCQRFITEFPFASEPYELLASISQEQGRDDEAKLLLKKALYLAPDSPSAYLELGAIYHSEGDKTRARKMREVALELLQQIPPESAVGPSGGPTAQEWIRHLKQLQAEGE